MKASNGPGIGLADGPFSASKNEDSARKSSRPQSSGIKKGLASRQ